MATVIPPQRTTMSAIETLPAELLEQILLETVVQMPPPIHYDDELNKYFRWEQEQMDLEGPMALRFLNIRLVCRKFRDVAWRAFGRVLGETVFDLGSVESMDNFHALASRPSLTRWIKKLTISCNIWYRCELGLLGLDDEHVDAVESVQGFEETWFPMSPYDLSYHYQFTPLSWTDMPSTIGAWVKTLIASLQGLPNVEEVAYVWDVDLLPQRYKAAWPYVAVDRQDICDTGIEAIGAHLGLTILIQALDGAGIQPHSLDLAIEFRDTRTFFVYAPMEAFSNICKNVVSLTLRDRQAAMKYHRDEGVNEPVTAVNKTLFPSLQSLVIDQIKYEIDPPAKLSPRDAEVADLTHLTIIENGWDLGYTKELLRFYGNHLQRFNYINPFSNRFNGLFDVMPALKVKVLSIQLFSDRHWESIMEDERRPYHWSNWDPEWNFTSLAEEVIFVSPGFKESVRLFQERLATSDACEAAQ